ncbi:MAG TPA: hypothetical protein DCP08_10390 [Chloroflexi bacterium]|nr:hypothetical protein [Chloroflexota bacterium]
MNNDERVISLLGRIVKEMARKETAVNDAQRVTRVLEEILKEMREGNRKLGEINSTVQRIERGIDRISSIENMLRNIDMKIKGF